MSTFKSYFFKEFLEAIRQYRVLILSFVATFFALTDPVILYFTPKILSSQFEGQGFDFSELIQTNQTASISNFLGDAYQIVGIVIIVMGFKLVIHEFNSRKIVIPYTNGSDNSMMILAKFVVYILIVNVVLSTSIALNHVYSGLVFDDFSANFNFTLHAMVSLVLFIDYSIAIMFLVSSITRNSIVVISVTLINYLLLPGLFNIFKIFKYTPYRLVESFSLIPFNKTAQISIILTIVLLILILSLAMIKIKRFELK